MRVHACTMRVVHIVFASYSIFVADPPPPSLPLWWDARRSRASPSVAGRPLFPVRDEERFADAGLDRRLHRREAARQDGGLARSPFPPYCATAGKGAPAAIVRTSVLVAMMKAVRTADRNGAAPPPVRGKPRVAVGVKMRERGRPSSGGAASRGPRDVRKTRTLRLGLTSSGERRECVSRPRAPSRNLRDRSRRRPCAPLPCPV